MSAATIGPRPPRRAPGRLAAWQRTGRRARQRGVAIITALLLTALAITIVASLFWEQQVQVRSMENQRLHLQTKWILRGVLDYARFALRETGRIDKGLTGLDGVWATPIAESRLDDYVEHDRVEGDTYKATFSGELTDAQARYNLTNLATGKIVDPGQVATFQRLLSSIQLDPALAQTAAQAIANSQQPASAASTGITTGGGSASSGASATSGTSTGTSASTGTGTASTGGTGSGGSEPMSFLNVEDLLSVPGFTAQVVLQLRPYLIVLPGPTKLNVNTAGPEVLAAVLNVSVSEASALVASRKSTGHFASVNDMMTLLGKNGTATDQIDLTSSYFLANSRIRLDRAALDAESLIQRQSTGLMTITLISIREI